MSSRADRMAELVRALDDLAKERKKAMADFAERKAELQEELRRLAMAAGEVPGDARQLRIPGSHGDGRR